MNASENRMGSPENNDTLCMRECLEQREREMLSEFAALAVNSKGRQNPRPRDEFRTEFQRDRDRILHCKAFRRLSHKTQVFIAPEGDHYRTRLTHTLEVSQIARSIARTLRLNEDLTEAVALGHDLGHTPFGHTGEYALDEALKSIVGKYPNCPETYEHVDQSLRIVEQLEYDGKGLNLTWETRDGIHGHSGSHMPATLEGQIVRISDRIAYINHDIDDALRAGVLIEELLPRDCVEILGHSSAERISTLVHDLVSQSAGQPKIRMSKDVLEAMMKLRTFMFEHVYEAPTAKREEPKAKGMVKTLFFHYLEHPELIPAEFGATDETLVVSVVDYVSGMTDRYAVRQFEKLFIPTSWRI